MNEFVPVQMPASAPMQDAYAPHKALALACGLTLAQWTALAREAQRLKAHPLDLALGEGLIEEPRFIDALARHCGITASLAPPPPLAPCRAEEAFALRSYVARDSIRVVAPAGAFVERLLLCGPGGPQERVILTTRQALLDMLMAQDGERLARRAAFELPEVFSARRWGPSWQRLGRIAPFAVAALVGVLLLGAYVAPLATLVTPALLLSPLFILAGLAVLTATCESLMHPRALLPTDRAALPRYTLLVPLHREAPVVPRLLQRLGALLYPRDRLDVLFLVEADDADTLDALRSAALPPSQLIVCLPAGEPRTKPRALNLGLPFVRGDFAVVYDAEDAPDPDQLLRAAALFRALPGHVACLQGRLGISNWRDGFLACRFAMDYAALFDCVKAGMGRAGWPVPLGGTSNHFRTEILKRVGGWDAWNVTEDADLGIRLARLGYIVEDLPSTTWEEAPNTINAWMNQRTRWLKGWFQTVMVHLSAPADAMRTLGAFRFLMIASIGLSVVLGALLYPVFLVGVGVRLLNPVPLGQAGGLLTLADAVLVLAIGVALLVELVPTALALWQRHALRLLPLVAFVPITHLMVSWAAWLALFELLDRPFFWHKTDHGKARREAILGPLRSTRKMPRA